MPGLSALLTPRSNPVRWTRATSREKRAERHHAHRGELSLYCRTCVLPHVVRFVFFIAFLELAACQDTHHLGAEPKHALPPNIAAIEGHENSSPDFQDQPKPVKNILPSPLTVVKVEGHL